MLTAQQAARVNSLKARGETTKDICAMLGYSQRDVLDAMNFRKAERERKRLALLAELRLERPPERTFSEHDRILRRCFPEAFAEAS